MRRGLRMAVEGFYKRWGAGEQYTTDFKRPSALDISNNKLPI
jgi:hypothetical protein